MRLKETLLILLCVICDHIIFTKPVTVPTNYNEDIDRFNRYSIKNYPEDDITRNKPNSFFNRLPMGYQAHVDSAQNDGVDDDDVDYDEHLTDKPSTANAQYLQQQQQYDTNSNNLYNENRIKKKKKKKRRIKRPCIPIQSFGSPLFSNRLKREHKNDLDDDREDRESGKTLGLLGLLGGSYGGGGYPGFYQPPYGGYYRPSYDNYNQRPQYDLPLYNPSGGYPCIPTNFGPQHQQGGYYGGNFGGNFGNFGGLFDFGNNQNDYQGPGNYPQTVINYNRPPLFGNFPNNQNQNFNNNNNNYNTPQGVQNNPLNNNYNNNNQFNRPGLTSSGKPLWEGIVDRVQEFVR
jgi:hypothetical protein